MHLAFTKMHGIGNDFVLIDAVDGVPALDAAAVRRLGDRRRGVGFDQLLVARPSEAAAVSMQVFNADGSLAEQCGNGLRCFARFVHARGRVDTEEFEVEVAGSNALVRLLDPDRVLVRLAAPGLEPADIPIRSPARQPAYRFVVGDAVFDAGAVSMGNPHVVLVVDDVDAAPVERLGAAVQALPELPESANVGFMQVLGDDRVRLRVYERGVGETEACGSGACAAVVSGQLRGLLGPEVRVALRGGELDIRWAGEGEPVWMAGPIAWVYEGEIDL